MKKFQWQSNSGVSLIEVVLAFGLFSILMYAILTLTSTQQNELRSLTEKLATLELDKFLLAGLADGSVCKAELTKSTVNSNAPYTIPSSLSGFEIELTKIHSSPAPTSPSIVEKNQPASPSSKTTIVRTIKIKDFFLVEPQNYMATLEITWVTEKLFRSLQPLSIRLYINTDPTRLVTGCGLKSSSGIPPVVLCVQSCGGAWPKKVGGWADTNDIDDIAYGPDCSGSLRNLGTDYSETYLCAQ